MPRAFVGLGANLGNARAQVQDAIAALRALPSTNAIKASRLYGSAPVDADGDDYVNAVALLNTTLSAHELLAALQAIEQAAGRERRYRNAPRTLDLDVLLYEDLQLHDEGLTVPHPRMTERAFVLLPLLELDTDVVVPGKGRADHYLAAVAGQAIHPLEKQE